MTQSAESDSTCSSKSQGTWWSPIGPTLFGPCLTQLGLGRFFNPWIIICKNWAGHMYQSNQIQLTQWIIIVMMVDVCFSFQLPFHLAIYPQKIVINVSHSSYHEWNIQLEKCHGHGCIWLDNPVKGLLHLFENLLDAYDFRIFLLIFNFACR